ncbi:hypothetical protein CDV55_100274 [Aspergillus turcosus]|uniref:Helitron helicase-like domain-containing protein n=1 Tax=Aspergillus turcosus TaxID=1245748 RepID=A0A229WRA6_9EURO|nr:hypothetical protein CDV55_100274 [Aspergillus turcosus]RLL92945.1 hypothetical protein CFD26_100293 [Aspergillus turcosus]
MNCVQPDEEDTPEAEALVNSITRFPGNLHGTRPFWGDRRRQLEAFVQKLGPTNVFLTLSAADLHWEDLIAQVMPGSSVHASNIGNWRSRLLQFEHPEFYNHKGALRKRAVKSFCVASGFLPALLRPPALRYQFVGRTTMTPEIHAEKGEVELHLPIVFIATNESQRDLEVPTPGTVAKLQKYLYSLTSPDTWPDGATLQFPSTSPWGLNIQTEPGPSHSSSAAKREERPPSKTRLIDSIGSLSMSLLSFNYKLHLNEARLKCDTRDREGKRAADEILLGDDGLIKMSDISQGKLEQTLLHPESAFSIAFSPDGQKLASATGRPF